MSAFRVTNNSTREAWLQAVQTLQAQMSRTNQQVTTGLKFSRPSEDPVAATRAMKLDNALSTNTQYASNMGLAKSRLNVEESALGQVVEVLQHLRELAVQANNASQTTETRAAIANEVSQQLEALVQLSNMQDGNGQYIFAGYQGNTQPFFSTASGVVFNGDQGVRLMQIGPDRRIADGDSGDTVFMRILNGNGKFSTTPAVGNAGSGVVGSSSVINPALYDGQTVYTVRFTSPTQYEVYDNAATPNLVTSGAYTPGQSITFAGVQFTLDGSPAAADEFVVAPSENQSVFSTVQNFITALKTPGTDEAGKAQIHNSIGRAMLELDQAFGKIEEVRSSVGSRLNAIDVQEDVNADAELNMKSLLSDIRDLDYADALTRLQQQLTSLQAAQQSYAMSQGLSLFNYL